MAVGDPVYFRCWLAHSAATGRPGRGRHWRRSPSSRSQNATTTAGPRCRSSTFISTKGSFLVLVGPFGLRQVHSACGSSPVLDDPTSGRLLDRRRDRQRCRTPRPQRRDGVPILRALPASVGRPEHRVRPQGARNRSRIEIERKVGEVAATLELTDYLGRKPAKLSGGQRQRVAMARALVRSPSTLSSWTSLFPTSTRGCAARCARRSRRCSAEPGSRPSTSPTTRSRR